MFAPSARSSIDAASPVVRAVPRKLDAGFPGRAHAVRPLAFAISQGVFIAVTAALFVVWLVLAR